MKDGTDAVADWPILNALLNTASGASWVSFHHGGGVGIGYSLHAGQVSVADGTDEAAAHYRRAATLAAGEPLPWLALAQSLVRGADPTAAATTRARGLVAKPTPDGGKSAPSQ